MEIRRLRTIDQAADDKEGFGGEDRDGREAAQPIAIKQLIE